MLNLLHSRPEVGYNEQYASVQCWKGFNVGTCTYENLQSLDIASGLQFTRAAVYVFVGLFSSNLMKKRDPENVKFLELRGPLSQAQTHLCPPLPCL